jgi:hypothetical protein
MGPASRFTAPRATGVTYQQTYLTFQTQQMLASVQLIEALGSGWDTTRLPGPGEVSAKTAAHLP